MPIKTKKKEEKWTFTSHHLDGTMIDFQNPKDEERTIASVIKGMEGLGYTCVERESSIENYKKAAL